MPTALHPQTQLTLKFDHQILPRAFGFPIKIRIPTKLGFKNPKYVTAMWVQNNDAGGYWENQGYNWFSGLIIIALASPHSRAALLTAVSRRILLNDSSPSAEFAVNAALASLISHPAFVNASSVASVAPSFFSPVPLQRRLKTSYGQSASNPSHFACSLVFLRPLSRCPCLWLLASLTSLSLPLLSPLRSRD